MNAQRDDGIVGRLLGLAARPLSAYWVAIATLLLAAVVGSLWKDAIFWEPLGGAVVVAGVVQVLARVQGVRAWPWS